MALAVESIGFLVMNISLFTGGMAFAILGLILGIARGMTKSAEKWAITFSAFSIAIAIIIPNIWFAGFIFAMGILGLLLSMMPLVDKLNDKHIVPLAIIAVTINLLIVVSVGAFTTSLAWQSNMDSTLTDIENVMGIEIGNLEDVTPANELCRPNEFEDNSTECESGLISGQFDENLFVPFASILTIGTYIGKAVAFMGAVLLAPIALSNVLTNEAYITNNILVHLMGMLLVLVDMAIFWKVIRFILDKRGSSS